MAVTILSCHESTTEPARPGVSSLSPSANAPVDCSAAAHRLGTASTPCYLAISALATWSAAVMVVRQCRETFAELASEVQPEFAGRTSRSAQQNVAPKSADFLVACRGLQSVEQVAHRHTSFRQHCAQFGLIRYNSVVDNILIRP